MIKYVKSIKYIQSINYLQGVQSYIDYGYKHFQRIFNVTLIKL